MTFSLRYIGQLIDTLETIKKYSGQHVTYITREEDFQPLRERMNEMVDHGLAIKPGMGNRPIFITRKGLDVLKMLKEVQARIKDEEGSGEYFYTTKEGEE